MAHSAETIERHLARAKAKERLRAFTEEADRQAYEESERLAIQGDAKPNPFGFLTATELCADPGPIEWRCKGLDMSPGRPIQLCGVGGIAKSWLLADQCIAVATGGKVWGEFPAKQGPVLALDYEMGSRISRRRIQRLAIGRGVPIAEVAEHLRLASMPPIHLNSDRWVDEMSKAAEGAALIAIDSLRRSLPGVDENDSKIERYLSQLTRISDRTGAVCVFAHHASPKGQHHDDRGAGRGSSAIQDGSGAVFLLTGKRGEPVKVTHTRTMELGRFIDPFFVAVEDVEVGNDPAAGVRVVTLDPDDPRIPSDDPSEEIDGQLCKAIIDYVAANPGCTGADVRRGVRGKVARIVGHLSHLVATDVLIAESRRGGGNTYRRAAS